MSQGTHRTQHGTWCEVQVQQLSLDIQTFILFFQRGVT